jgi:hypothetical protein
MINNFSLIKPYLHFEKTGDCFFIQIISRKKDGALTSASNIKDYYVTSIEQYDKLEPKIIEICNFFNARAYIRLNQRNINENNLLTISEIIDRHIKNQSISVIKLYASVMGSHNSEKNKKWLLDIDNIFDETDSRILKYIEVINNECQPKGNKILGYIPSKNGFHIVTSPFNLQIFSKTYPEIKIDEFIHKDTPTNLYIPD